MTGGPWLPGGRLRATRASVATQRVALRDGTSADIAPTEPDDHAELYHAFGRIVAADDGYPQDPAIPLTVDAFDAYWLTPAIATAVARLTDDRSFAGAYTMKPNGVGRAAHVANAGYFVVAERRGCGLGEALVRHSIDTARRLGFDALQFNFVFESNPARRLYERLGFELVGRVPEVIGEQAVCLYWRKL
jgi:GNAT superfamily N-acetyltransferase